jgi:2-oxoglutarate dehydrogenase E1 component
MNTNVKYDCRLNVLHSFLGKTLSSICNKFNEAEYNSGDVKYHLGARAQLKISTAHLTSDEPNASCSSSVKLMHVSLCANPSHLEAVYPVVIGKTKAKQVYVNDKDMTKVMPLILHGDAAFIGQGIVPETMQVG